MNDRPSTYKWLWSIVITVAIVGYLISLMQNAG